jgi:hypothetical protein
MGSKGCHLLERNYSDTEDLPHRTSPSISFTLALHANDFCFSFSPSPSVASIDAEWAGASKSLVLRILRTMYSRSLAVSSVRECENLSQLQATFSRKTAMSLTHSDTHEYHKPLPDRGHDLSIHYSMKNVADIHESVSTLDLRNPRSRQFGCLARTD